MTDSSPDDAAAVRLADVLDLKAAAGLHGDLLRLRGQDVILDASGVSRLGGQCLQILLSAINTWKADGRSLSFDNPSTAFIDGLELFGANRNAAPQLETLA
jgi:chemotaxis protein CheX